MYESIVIGTDGSSTARMAVNEAAKLAEAFGSDVHLVSAYQAPGSAATATAFAAGAGALYSSEWDVSAREVVEKELSAAAGELEARGLRVEIHAVPGSPVSAILDVAAATSASLIVVGSKGMTGARRVLGSVPNAVAHRAPCAVLVVKTC